MLSLSLGLSLTSGQGGGAAGSSAVALEYSVYGPETMTAGGPVNDATLCQILEFDVGSPVISPPNFTITGVQFSVQGPLDSLYIGPQAGAGDAYDASSLTEITFSGNSGITQTRDDTTLSDVVPFTWDKTGNLVTALYTGAAPEGAASATTRTYTDLRFTTSLGDEAADLDKTTGYSTLAETLYMIKEMIFHGEATPQSIYSEAMVTANAITDTTMAHLLRFDHEDIAPPDFTVTAVQFVVQGPLDSLYVGPQAESGETYDAESLTQITFGGNSGVTQDRDETTTSDIVLFDWDKAGNLIASLFTGATPEGSADASSVNYIDTYFSSANGDESADAAKTAGYTEATNRVFFIKEMILYGES